LFSCDFRVFSFFLTSIDINDIQRFTIISEPFSKFWQVGPLQLRFDPWLKSPVTPVPGTSQNQRPIPVSSWAYRNDGKCQVHHRRSSASNPRLDFREDTCNINRYIKRMQNNDISKMINMERQDISPAVYSLLQNSQPTTASVQRSFSMLKKLLAKDRHFKAENVHHYMILHFNSSTWWLACSVMSQDLCNSTWTCVASFVEHLRVFV